MFRSICLASPDPAGTFNKHEEKINKILENIGADFKIDNFKGKDDHRRSEAVSCGFNIKPNKYLFSRKFVKSLKYFH